MKFILTGKIEKNRSVAQCMRTIVTMTAIVLKGAKGSYLLVAGGTGIIPV